METVINLISETNNGGWAELQKRWRPFIIKRLAKKTLLSSAEAKERKTSDAILCPFVLILRHTSTGSALALSTSTKERKNQVAMIHT